MRVWLQGCRFARIFKNYFIESNRALFPFSVCRQKRKVQQQRQKLQEKMRLKMILPGDTKDMETDMEIFSLVNIKSKQVTFKIVM